MRRTVSRRRTVACGIVGVAIATGVGGCADDGPPPAATTTAPPAPTSPPASTTEASPSPTSATVTGPTATGRPTAAHLAATPVYWIAESRRSFALYREFRTVPDVGGAVASAVAAMTRMQPLDRDYLTPWRPASRVTATQRGDAITVDLSADAFASRQVGSELAERAVQQMVYTATAAAAQAGRPARTVAVTVDGRPYDAWGVLRLGDPMPRAPMTEVQAHAWVVSPQEGERRPAGTVRFTGYGTSFEATFAWQVRTAAGTVVARGSAMGGTGAGGFGQFTFTASLRPGTYVVEVSTDDPSGGAEGPGAATDDKTFTVR